MLVSIVRLLIVRCHIGIVTQGGAVGLPSYARIDTGAPPAKSMNWSIEKFDLRIITFAPTLTLRFSGGAINNNGRVVVRFAGRAVTESR